MLELYLKREGCIDREERVSQLRLILTGILDSFHISDLDNVGLAFCLQIVSLSYLAHSYFNVSVKMERIRPYCREVRSDLLLPWTLGRGLSM